MAEANAYAALSKAFSGLGVDESLFVSTLGKWNRHQRESYRVSTPGFFREDERQFQRWDDEHILQLRQEFLRLKDAIVLYTMHPWERDARLFKEALLLKVPKHDVIIETACTRSSEDLLGARKAYHSLFEHSIEEDIAHYTQSPERKLLVALVSSYRYEGPRVDDGLAKSEAKIFVNAIKNANKKKLIDEDEEIVRILSTRSKLHLKAIYSHYKEITGNFLDEDLEGDLMLKQVVQCLCVPQVYFSKDIFLKKRGCSKNEDENMSCRAAAANGKLVFHDFMARERRDLNRLPSVYGFHYWILKFVWIQLVVHTEQESRIKRMGGIGS